MGCLKGHKEIRDELNEFSLGVFFCVCGSDT